MRVLASALTYLLFLLALPFLLTHKKLRHGIRERLGFYPRHAAELGAGPRIRMHGASAGDVLALMPTVRELVARRPDVQIILSTMTNSGRVMAEREKALVARTIYVPYDLPGSVHRALARLRPDVLVLEYTELWPQLIHAAARRGVSLVLHNGRLSSARLGNYRLLFALTGNLLAPFKLLLMRDEQEAETALKLMASPQALRVTGNTKFDNLATEPPRPKIAELERATGFSGGELVWVAGSTHEGEEEILLDIFVALRKSHDQLRLVIAPRYIERAERIRGLAVRRDLTTRLRSQPGAAADVLILDTIGELAACYELATLVFVGGSFVERGGQNILEPAARGKPVLFGPHMENFADSVQVLLGRGGMQVASPEQLQRVMADLLARPEYRAELGAMAATQVSRVRGAAARNAELIAGLVEPAGSVAQPIGHGYSSPEESCEQRH